MAGRTQGDIAIRDVVKTFRQTKRRPGVLGAIKTLVSPEIVEVTAVSGISFDVAAGEAVGYLGPNGAGKSTMIKMMTGILVPTAGTISVFGRAPHHYRMANAARIGVVFGQRSQLWWDLPITDSFNLHRHIYNIPIARYEANLLDLSMMLSMGEYLDRPVRQLSLGQRMRAEIALALLHDPEILFLDEPTIGLDVVAKDAVRKFLVELNRKRGTTIILTTHDMQDIEQICPRLVMVDEGKLLFDGALPSLRKSLGFRRRLTLEFASDPGPVQLMAGRLHKDEGSTKHFLLEREDTSILQVLMELGSGYDLKDASLHEPDIDEVVRTFYQQKRPLP